MAADQKFIATLQENAYELSENPLPMGTYPGPALVLCGRDDAVVGHVQAMGLSSTLIRATTAILDGARHLVQLERPGLSTADG